MEAIFFGRLGYTKDPEVAISMNEDFIKQKDREAIKRKVDVLAYGKYGFTPDPETAYKIARKWLIVF